jgi:hypothetical protein
MRHRQCRVGVQRTEFRRASRRVAGSGGEPDSLPGSYPGGIMTQTKDAASDGRRDEVKATTRVYAALVRQSIYDSIAPGEQAA